jgi:hypothetical protein
MRPRQVLKYAEFRFGEIEPPARIGCAGTGDLYIAFKSAPDFGNDPSGSFSRRTLVS